MNGAVELRAAGEEDADAIRRLLSESGLPLEGLEGVLDRALVALREGRLVGCVALELYGRVALLRSLAVAPAERGSGLGERLTREALELAHREGVRDVYLLTETAEGFFPRFGFAAEDRALAPAALGESEEFRSACPASARMMHARLEAR